MAYVALYRAYRPQKFSEVVGQEHVIKTLQNAIKLNKVAHAYLFCGPRGTGKTTLAKIMAKAMNCETGPTTEPCCECEICKGITKGIVSDVIEIDAASNNSADDIRSLRETVKFLPSQGRYKIYIIDEVHMLSPAAFNALLKTLEEPPSHVIFILATTEPYKLPNTILSRCQRFDFSSISLDDILKRLKIVAEEENIKISNEALHQIALSAEGGMRDALSLFDQAISYSVNEEITLDDVLDISGNISYMSMINLLNYAKKADGPSAIKLVDEIIKNGKEVPRIVNDLILFLRDVLLYKNNAILDEKLMYDNQEFQALANMTKASIIYSWINILNDALNQMRFSTQKRAYLELAILKMSDAKENDNASLSERLMSLEHEFDKLMTVNKPARINSGFQPEFSSNEDLIRLRNESRVEPVVNNVQKPEVIKPVEQPVPQQVESFDIPEEVEAPKLEVVIPDDEINVDDIYDVLKDASKDAKEVLTKAFTEMKIRYSELYTIQMLTRGNIVAASNNSFIIELADSAFCNRIMNYENFVKIIEILTEYNLDIKDYICIPKEVWSKIKVDYMSKYKKGGEIKLDPVRTYVKRRRIPEVKIESEEDKMINSAKEFFENDDLIVEE